MKKTSGNITNTLPFRILQIDLFLKMTVTLSSMHGRATLNAFNFNAQCKTMLNITRLNVPFQNYNFSLLSTVCRTVPLISMI